MLSAKLWPPLQEALSSTARYNWDTDLMLWSITSRQQHPLLAYTQQHDFLLLTRIQQPLMDAAVRILPTFVYLSMHRCDHALVHGT